MERDDVLLDGLIDALLEAADALAAHAKGLSREADLAREAPHTADMERKALAEEAEGLRAEVARLEGRNRELTEEKVRLLKIVAGR